LSLFETTVYQMLPTPGLLHLSVSNHFLNQRISMLSGLPGMRYQGPAWPHYA